MINEEGVKITMIGWSKKSGISILFKYEAEDFLIKSFDVSKVYSNADKINLAAQEEKVPYNDISIGPICEVGILKDYISRELSPLEGSVVKKNIEECMLQHKKFPLAKAPFPEEILFSLRYTRRAFKLDMEI